MNWKTEDISVEQMQEALDANEWNVICVKVMDVIVCSDYTQVKCRIQNHNETRKFTVYFAVKHATGEVEEI